MEPIDTGSIFVIENASGLGTAFLIGSDTAVTAAHVVEDYDFVRLSPTNSPNSLVAARVIARDIDSDLAVVHLSRESSSTPLKFASDLVVGDSVTAVGAPSGVITEASGRVTAINDSAILSSASVAPGYSGGPLLSPAGEVVGVVTQFDAKSGYAYAVPTDLVLDFAESVPTSNFPTPKTDSLFPSSLTMSLCIVGIVLLGAIIMFLRARNKKDVRNRQRIRITIEGM